MSTPDHSLIEDAFESGEAQEALEAGAVAQLGTIAPQPEANGEPAPAKQTAMGAVAQSVWAKLLIVGVNAGTGILSARGLQPTGRGELTAMILWPVFLGSATTLGIPSALTFNLRSRGRDSQSMLVGAGLLISLMTSLIAMVIGAIFLPHWIPQYPPNVIFYARVFLLSCPLTSVVLVGRAALESHGDFTASNKLLITSPLLTLIWLAVLRITHTMTPVSAALAYVPVGIIPVAWMIRMLWTYYTPKLSDLNASFRLLFSYGLRSYGIDLCGAMALYVDQALVVRVLDPATMGTYVVALSLSRMLNAFHTSVVMVLFPKAVAQTPETVREMTGLAARMSTLLTAAAGLCIVLVGGQALTLLYGKEYRGALAVLDVLVLEVVLAGATLVASQAFMALGRPGVITVLQVFGLLLTIPLVLVLAPRYGILGAGLALLCSTICRLTFVMVSYPVTLKIRPPQIVPTWSDAKFLTQTILQRVRRSKVSHA